MSGLNLADSVMIIDSNLPDEDETSNVGLGGQLQAFISFRQENSTKI